MLSHRPAEQANISRKRQLSGMLPALAAMCNGQRARCAPCCTHRICPDSGVLLPHAVATCMACVDTPPAACARPSCQLMSGANLLGLPSRMQNGHPRLPKASSSQTKHPARTVGHRSGLALAHGEGVAAHKVGAGCVRVVLRSGEAMVPGGDGTCLALRGV